MARVTSVYESPAIGERLNRQNLLRNWWYALPNLVSTTEALDYTSVILSSITVAGNFDVTPLVVTLPNGEVMTINEAGTIPLNIEAIDALRIAGTNGASTNVGYYSVVLGLRRAIPNYTPADFTISVVLDLVREIPATPEEILDARFEEVHSELASLSSKVNTIDLTGTAGLVSAFAKGFQIPKGPDHPGNFVLSVSVDVNTNEVTREWRTL